MPLITGDITRHGAVIRMLVGVSQNRRQRLEAANLRVPDPVPVRAVVDTGSHVTGMSRAVFEALEIGPFGRTLLRTPTTTPGNPALCEQYDVALSLGPGPWRPSFPSVHVIAGADFHLEEESHQGIIGRDVLDHCVFEYLGTDHRFMLAF